MAKARAHSVLQHVILGLVPYTDQNLMLAFKPNLFFNELQKISGRKANTIRNVYYRAQKQGLFEVDATGIPRLTDKGRLAAQPYEAKVLSGGAQLMIIFDIPEQERAKRLHLRRLLKDLSFVQIQKSVWVSPLDYRQLLKQEIAEHHLHPYVVLYEVAPIRP
jgi:DNA-binding transcriptional regulator PaaX